MGNAPAPFFAVAQGFHGHPKARAAGRDGRALYLAALDYCTLYQTDGKLTAAVLPTILSWAEVPFKTVARVVAAGLLEVVRDGWEVHNFFAWQRSREDIQALTDKRREAGQKGAAARWQTDGNPDGKRHSKTMAPPWQGDGKAMAETETECLTQSLLARNGGAALSSNPPFPGALGAPTPGVPALEAPPPSGDAA